MLNVEKMYYRFLKYMNTPFNEKYMDQYEFDRRISDAIIITSKD
jgi:hypothetical protein